MSVPPPHAFWARLEFQLSEIRDLLSLRLETKAEAVGTRISPANRKTGKKAVWRDTAPRWVDDEHGRAVRPWLMMPYVNAFDQRELQERIEAGKRLLHSVEKSLAAKELSPQFLHEWGLLNRVAGVIELIYHLEPDVGRLRAADNLDGHKRWFAHYALRIYRHGNLEEVRDEMERFINKLAQGWPEGDERDWFERFLSDLPSERWEGCRRLTGAFRDDLTGSAMKQLVQERPGNIPRLDLEFPLP